MSIKEGNDMDILREIANIQGQISDLQLERETRQLVKIIIIFVSILMAKDMRSM